MSFLFKSKKDKQGNALPNATRNITSSDGTGPIPNSFGAIKDEKNNRPPTANGSIGGNYNLGSFGNINGEQKTLRDRADSEPPQQNRAQAGVKRYPLDSSPYPWSQWRMQFSSAMANPFPRYGAAANSLASKDGTIYLMGGLINGSSVKGDLWTVEAGAGGNITCFSVTTQADGPGPRVGHASLLVGNAFIVFGGDTKTEDGGDSLDDTLYLLNTSTRQWSRALPAGPRPSGRYGHSLNILQSKIYIFGGQVEGFFFNDLVAFDLNALQNSNNRWEVLIPLASEPTQHQPPARTNHTVVTWNDKLYLFGGTDGMTWYNDVWCYDPRLNTWLQLECIGYIPVAREGHSAALVGDTMYIFGGRTEEGTDLGDLAAFRISTRRWYTFQNMGPSPSPRSGHSMTAFGKQVVVLGGEPSTAPRDPAELSMAYILDTSKIRYPNDQGPPSSVAQRAPSRPSLDRGDGTNSRSGMLADGAGPPSRTTSQDMRSGSEEREAAGPLARQGPGPGPPPGAQPPPPGSRLPRGSPGQGPSGPPPPGQAPPPRLNGSTTPQGTRSRTPTGPPRPGPEIPRQASFDRGDGDSAMTREIMAAGAAAAAAASPTPPSVSAFQNNNNGRGTPTRGPPQQQPQGYVKESFEAPRAVPQRMDSRNTRTQRQQPSIDSTSDYNQSRQSFDDRPSMDHPSNGSSLMKQDSTPGPPGVFDSGIGSSPSLHSNAPSSYANRDSELTRELDAAKQRNQWYASELALARKQGYRPTSSSPPMADGIGDVGEEDKPLVEALLNMRKEIERVKDDMNTQRQNAAREIAEAEAARDKAVKEAVGAKARLNAQADGEPARDADTAGTLELRSRLAQSLTANTDLRKKHDALQIQAENEKKARQVAEETADAAQKRVNELDAHRQRSAAELEGMKAELQDTQKTARDEAANHLEQKSKRELLEVDHNELSEKWTRAVDENKTHSSNIEALRVAVAASEERSTHLEKKLDQERTTRDTTEHKLSQLRVEHEQQTAELESVQSKLREAEEIAEKHAAEARTHRAAVLTGLSKPRALEEEDAAKADDQRVAMLQMQLQAANGMVRKNQEAADAASERLRMAEERIAGLEAYQEQASREGLSMRRQLQQATKESQQHAVEKSDLQQQLQQQQQETNAITVQHSALREILDERANSAAESRQEKERFGTPEMNRMKDLETQLEQAIRNHEELKSNYEDREQQVSRDWEEKLTALDNDHQAAVKYLRGTEKMLSKMKQELTRYKTQNLDLQRELEALSRSAASTSEANSADWMREREQLQSQIAEMQRMVKDSVSQLEKQMTEVQSQLHAAQAERDQLRITQQKAQSDLSTANERHRIDLEQSKRDNAELLARAEDAENKVQLLLDQVESSVDSYRRQSTNLNGGRSLPNGTVHSRHLSAASSLNLPREGTSDHGSLPGHNKTDSFGGLSTYSGTSTINGMGNDESGLRNSMALDSLASELDALRTHWETQHKNYRLSAKYDFDRSPLLTSKSSMGEGAGSSAIRSPEWRRGLDLGDDDMESPAKDKGEGLNRTLA